MKTFRYEEIDSTNDKAHELLETNSEFCVVADYQTKGRGRNNKVWKGKADKGLYVSFGLVFGEPIESQYAAIHQGIGALAVKYALDKQFNREIKPFEVESQPNLVGRPTFKIKYPNDVYALNKCGQYKKISGILLENNFIGSQCESIVLGIGINLYESEFDDDLQDRAISLCALKRSIYKEEILQDLIVGFTVYKNSLEESFDFWKASLDILGKKALILNDTSVWTISKILPDMRLLAVRGDEKRIIDNGDSIRYGDFLQTRINS